MVNVAKYTIHGSYGIEYLKSQMLRIHSKFIALLTSVNILLANIIRHQENTNKKNNKDLSVGHQNPTDSRILLIFVWIFGHYGASWGGGDLMIQDVYFSLTISVFTKKSDHNIHQKRTSHLCTP